MTATVQRTILVVDDSADLRALLRAYLTKAGHRVLLAEDGQAALGLLAADERPAMALIDFMMPGMDGPEVVKAIRALPNGRELPILMLTASQDENHIESAFSAGANDYMTKPVERRIVTARVEAMIRAAEDHARVGSVDRMDEERRAMQKELEEAARVQRARLPAMPFASHGWAVTGGLAPSRHIGGDFFDRMEGPEGAIVVALVDISGHGLAAALVAGSVGSELRALAGALPLPEAIRRLNAHLARAGIDNYACVAVLVLEGARATVINAGLPPVCLVRGGRCVALVEGSGTPPGLVADADYDETVLELVPGDRLVAMSDGLTEPFGGADHVSACLDSLALTASGPSVVDQSFEQVTGQIRRLLERNRPGESDDATLVIAELRGVEATREPARDLRGERR
jgi:phosphoserine phosphatase RsbU/P